MKKVALLFFLVLLLSSCEELNSPDSKLGCHLATDKDGKEVRIHYCTRSYYASEPTTLVYWDEYTNHHWVDCR